MAIGKARQWPRGLGAAFQRIGNARESTERVFFGAVLRIEQRESVEGDIPLATKNDCSHCFCHR